MPSGTAWYACPASTVRPQKAPWAVPSFRFSRNDLVLIPRGLGEPRWRSLWHFRGASSRGVSGGCSGIYTDTCTPSQNECPHGSGPRELQRPQRPRRPLVSSIPRPRRARCPSATAAPAEDAHGGGKPAGCARSFCGRVLPASRSESLSSRISFAYGTFFRFIF